MHRSKLDTATGLTIVRRIAGTFFSLLFLAFLMIGSLTTPAAALDTPSVVVTASPNPSVSGETVTLTATVTAVPPAVGTPSGTVTFTGPGLFENVALDGAGVALYMTDGLLSGTITAHYEGDGNFETAEATVIVTVNPVNPGDTSTSVSVSPDPSVTGQSVTVTAFVTVTPPASGMPTGTVTFTGPGGLNKTVPVLGTGEAFFTTTALATGTITATYSGDAAFNGSVGTTTATVDTGETTTSVTASPNSAFNGQSVAVTATVTPVSPASGTPTGTVTFSGPGGFSATVPVDGVGQAALTTTTLTTGTITATYNGDAGFDSSTGTTAIMVDPGVTTTVVTVSPNPSIVGQSVTVTATVTPVSPASGTPSGTVTFTGPGGLLQTATLDGTGQAFFTTTALATGTVTATYSGDANFDGSAGTTTVMVDPSDTVTFVSVTPDPSIAGQSVTITAMIIKDVSASGTPTGTVTFTGPGGLLETATLDGTGQAAFTTTALATGTVTATYSGDAAFNGSVGTTTATVEPGDTATSVTASPDPSMVGQTVTVSATVTAIAPATGTPTGTVTFTGAGGLNETVTLDGTGQAVLTTTQLVTGTITATYSGGGALGGSVGTTAVTVNDVVFVFAPSAGALPAAEEDLAYQQTISVSGGTAPYSYTVTAGSLPDGLSLNSSTGKISGTATDTGAYSFTVSVTDANHRVGSVAYTLAVAMSRPDPSTDPEVLGLLEAQIDTARRLGQAQVRNFNGRLERLHNEGDRRASSMDVRVGFAQRNPTTEAERQINQVLAGDTVTAGGQELMSRSSGLDVLGYGTDGLDVSNGGSHSANPVAAPDLGRFAIWSGGFVNFGENDKGGLALDYTLVGVSGGIDYRFSDQFVAGFGAGYGRDRTDVGDNGTENRTNAYSAAVYGSYQPVANLFIDGLAGASWLDLDSRRLVTSNGDFVSGNRSGTQVFGTVTAAYEFRDEVWLVSPYGRFEFTRTWLDEYSETGNLGLTYDEQTFDTLAGAVGLRVNRSFQTDWGILTPGARVEYTHDFEGSTRASLGYTDLVGPSYAVDIDQKVRDVVTLGISLDVELDNDWNIGLDYNSNLGGSDYQDHTIGAKLRVSF